MPDNPVQGAASRAQCCLTAVFDICVYQEVPSYVQATQVQSSDGFAAAVKRVLGCISASRLCVVRCAGGRHRAPTLAGSAGDIISSWGTGNSIRIVNLSMRVSSVKRTQQHYHRSAMLDDLRAELMQWVGIGPGFMAPNDIHDLGRVVDFSIYRRQAGV